MTSEVDALNVMFDSAVRRLEATTNAVVVQMVRDVGHDGEVFYRRVVTIECVDDSMLPVLRAEAHRILNK